MFEMISSRDNKILKEIRQLSHKKFRDQLGQFLIEGQTIIEEAIDNSAEIKLILVCEELFPGNNGSIDGPTENDRAFFLSRLQALGAPLYKVERKLFIELSDTTTPQGILGIAVKKQLSQDDFFKGKTGGNFIVLDRLSDPGNLGTMIRTADAAGFQGVIVLKGSGDIYAPKVIRATAGSIFRIPVLLTDTPEETIASLKANKKKILCTMPKADKIYYDVDMERDVAIVIGNEANGVGEAFMNHCDIQVRIPMSGAIESLNAAVAAGILMYESMRQKIK